MHRLAALLCAAAALVSTSIASAQDMENHPPPAPGEENPLPPELDRALHGVPGGLTAGSAAAAAVRTSPSVDHARAAARTAHAGAVRAIGAFLPRIDTSARYTRLSEIAPVHFFPQISDMDAATLRATAASVMDTPARVLLQQSVEATIAQGNSTLPFILNQYVLHAGVSWPVSDLFLTVLPAYNANDHLASSSNAQLESQRQSVAVQARDAFYSVARARGALLVAELAVQQADAHKADVQVAVQAGVAAPVEQMRIDAQAAAARVQLARARGGVATAEAALRTLLHMGPHDTLNLGEDLTAVPEPMRGDVDTLLSSALSTRPELTALRHIVEARGSLVDVRTGQMLPHVILAANADYANPNQRIFPQQDKFTGSWDATVQLTWSPNDLFNASQDLDAAHGDLAAARADLAALEDGVRVEVTQSYEGYVAAREALDAARLGEAASEEAYRVRRERYRAGVATTTELIDATSDLLVARLNFVNAAIDLHVADAHLRRAVGQDVTH